VDTAYTYVNDTTVQLATAPGAGVRVEVRRVTPATTPLVDFADGSTLVAADLDTSNLQHLYLEQELDDANKQAIFVDPATGLLTAANQRITNVANPVNAQDVSTKAYTDAQIDSALINDVIAGTGLTISDNTPTAGQITVGITNSGVGVTQIADGAVTSAKIADATIITGDLADGAVTSAKIADGTIVAGDLASDSVTTAKILNANVTTAKIADLNVTTGKIADLGVTTGKIADAAITAAKIAGGSIDSTKLDGATVVTNSEHSGSTPNDTSFFTTSASDARYFRQDSSETISSGNAWSASDSYVATTAAIDARVIDLVDDVGGFVPIANENSFPVANPDINNPDGTGTIVSIAVMSTSRTPSSGTVTIANGSGSNTVTITGCGSTVLAAGFGVLVETTSTLHTYTFHRLTPKATEVTTVASISADVTTVAGNNANVTAVAGNAANITTVAGSIANVNAVGGSIANVNSVASNLASVNSFANTYRIAASDPATSLDVGDLVFNTTANELRVYNGSVWQGGVTATGNLVSRSGDTMTGALAHPLGAAATPSITFTGDTNTGIYSPGADQVAISTNGTGRLFVDASGRVSVGSANIPNYGIKLGSLDNIGIVPSAQDTVGSSVVVMSALGSASSENFIKNEITNFVNGANYGTALSFQTRSTTAGVERLRIDSSGRVGVGTSSPSANTEINAALDTGASIALNEGQLSIGREANSGGALRIGYDTTNNFGFISSGRVGVSWDKLILNAGGGNVGIGTSVPSQLLTLAQTNAGSAVDCLFLNNSSNASGTAVGIAFGPNTTNDTIRSAIIRGINEAGGAGNSTGLGFFTNTNGANPSEKLRITAGGSVGIGTTSISEKLTISDGSIRLDSTTATSRYIQFNDTAGIRHIIGSDASAGTNELGIRSEGQIVFGAGSGRGEKARLTTDGKFLVGASTASSLNPSSLEIYQSGIDNTDLGRNALLLRKNEFTAGNQTSTLFRIQSGTSTQNQLAAGLFTDSGGASGSFFDQVSGSIGLTFRTGGTERFRISGTGAQSSVIPGGSTLYPSFDCRAWIAHNSGTLQGNGNISSLTRNGTGDYTINFSTAMPDVNYAPVFMGEAGRIITKNTGSFNYARILDNGAATDGPVGLAIFR
jgi:hypothetical protein